MRTIVIMYTCVSMKFTLMPFDDHSSTQTKSISLHIQQDHYREPNNMDALVKVTEKVYNKHINLIKPELKL